MKKQKGITLIALIITIIVMLILVGVTINVALNGGLFGTTEWAADQTKTAAEKEQLLAAVLATIGTNGEVDFDKVVLPDGFDKVIGKNGVYKSTKSGTTYTVDPETLFIEGSTGDSEDADNPILGIYYSVGGDISGKLALELKSDNKATLKGYDKNQEVAGEMQGTYTYDKNSKTGKITILYEYEDSTTGEVITEPDENSFNYIEIINESGNTINSILEMATDGSAGNAIFAKKDITGLISLTGYVYENGTDTIEFSTSVENGVTLGVYVMKTNGVVLESTGGNYVCYNGKLVWNEGEATVSNDLSTITVEGTVYTLKQQ